MTRRPVLDPGSARPAVPSRACVLAACLAAAWLLVAAGPAGAAPAAATVSPELFQKAWSRGTVRVIVELGGAGARPEGSLPDRAAVTAQRSRIAADQAALRRALRGLRHRVLREFRTVPYVGLEVDPDALRLLEALPGLVTAVHEDVLLRPMLAQSGPLVRAPDAWAADRDGTGQVVAIIDTGVDKAHPFLAGKVVAEACYDSSGVSTCPNGLDADTGAGAGVPCTFAPQCPHGTHVAGIAAGNGPGAGVSFSGVARGASLLPIRVFHEDSDPADCAPDAPPCARASFMDIVQGLEHVYDLRDTYAIAAANLSLGAGAFTVPCDGVWPAMDTAIANLRAAGIATVVASGNEGFIDAIAFPACISTAISVGATTDGSGGLAADQVAWFSNSAAFLSLLAPGYLINSSVPGEGFANFPGTSMAAPHVAGAWAVMKQADPDASVDDVLEGLQNTGKPITDPGNGVATPRIAFTVLQLSASAYSVAESAGVATITVTRSGASFGAVTVDYATSAGSAIPDQDYVETSGTLTFAPGQTSRTFSVPILNDTAMDGPRTVALALSGAGGGALLGARDTAVLTITDNDAAGSVQFSASAYSVGEAGGTATVTVTRTGGSASGVTVQYATSDGTAHAGVDYAAAAGTLTFGAGETSRTFQVTILPNAVADGNRTIDLALSSPGGGASLGGQKTAVLTIVDDEVALQFSQASYTVAEKAGSATVTVTRSGPAAPPVSVAYAVLPGSAAPGADYGGAASGVLSFAANQVSRTFTIPIVNDTLAEGPETVLLQLGSPSGALLGPRHAAVLTILDDDAGGAFRFGASAYAASECAATATVTVTRSGGSASNGTVRLRTVPGGTAVPGVDYQPLDQVLSFGAGQLTRTVPVTLLTAANVTVDGPRTIRLALEEPGPTGLASLAAPSTTTVTIGDNDVGGTVQWGPAAVTASESAPGVTLTAVRTGGAADQVGVTWTITGGTAVHGVDYTGPTSGTLTFGAGVPTQPLTIPLLDPPGAQGTRTLQVTLSAPTGGGKLGPAKVATVTLLDDEVGIRFGQAIYAASEGSATATITVVRTGPTAPVVGVSYGTVEGEDGTAVPGTDYVPVTGVLTFLAGQTTKTFTVPLRSDLAVDGLRTVKLRLSGPTGGAELGTPADAILNLGDNDAAGVFRFASGTYTAVEGTTVNVAVTRTGGTGGPVDVPWSVTGGTATLGTDVLLASSGVLTFGPNETTKTIPVPVANDADVEANETVVLTLGAPAPAGALGTPGTATVVVVDGDRKGTIQFAAPAVIVAEADSLVQVAVTRAGSVADPATVAVQWAVTGGTATPGTAPAPGVDVVLPAVQTVEFLPGQATQTIPIQVRFDAEAEGPETLVLSLLPPDPASGWALGAVTATTLTLVEGTVQFAASTFTAGEGSASATITVTRSGLTTQPATVGYSLTPGSATPAPSASACGPGAAYRPVSGSLLFGAGQTSRTFSVPLCGDTLVEGNETVFLDLAVLSGPVIPGTPASATLVLVENDLGGAFRFSSPSYSAGEGQATATLTVTRTGTGGGAQVHWAITGGTAIPGVDYTGPAAGDLTFAAGQTSRSLSIPLVNTAAADGPRTLVVELSSPLPAGLASLGTPAQATLTIRDDEPTLRLSGAAYAASEGSAAVAVTVLRSGPAAPALSVELVPQATGSATGGTCGTGGADFAASAIPVTLNPNQTSKSVVVPLCPDTRAEGGETFTVALANPVGAALGSPAAAAVSLADDDLAGTLRWSVADASGVEGDSVLLTVTRTGGLASDVTVQVTTHDGDADTPGADAVAGVDYEALAPTTLTFDAGVVSQSVAISLLPRDGAQGPRAFRVILHDAAGGATLGTPSAVTVWILDPS